MIALIQRVSTGSVRIEGESVGAIDRGLVALIGVVRGDGRSQADRLLQRMLDYRVFPDPAGRMNLSLRQTGGGLLLVPQFTLAADTARGNRASFTPAAAPAEAGHCSHTWWSRRGCCTCRSHRGSSVRTWRCRSSMTVRSHFGYRQDGRRIDRTLVVRRQMAYDRA